MALGERHLVIIGVGSSWSTARRSPSASGCHWKASLSSLAHRIQALDIEIAELDEKIESLVLATAPDLLGLFGVGPDTAAALLVAAGDNPERLHSEADWAHLCGVSPIPADSGKNAGHLRHHQGGHRQVNSLHCGASSWSASPTILRRRLTSSVG